MYELIQTGPRSFYVNCPAKIGIYLQDPSQVYLIDSGNDKEAGKKVLKILDRNGWSLKGILNTHSNADHIGGNRLIQQRTGCKIFSGGIEAAFTRYPVLEPAFLYGGFPCKELRHKFLMATESDVSDFSDPEFPREVEILPLPGHFFHMVGFRTPDDVVFLADCLSSGEMLEKYQLSFIYDVAAYLETLDAIGKMEAALFVPSHAEPAKDIRPLAELNRAKVFEIAGQILALCREPQTFETVLAKLFSLYHLTMTFEQYALIGSTVRSYLSWLSDTGQAEAFFEDNRMLWRAVPGEQ